MHNDVDHISRRGRREKANYMEAQNGSVSAEISPLDCTEKHGLCRETVCFCNLVVAVFNLLEIKTRIQFTSFFLSM
jgi:hypothetical protein